MKKIIVVLLVVSLSILCFIVKSFANEIAWQDIGRGNTNIKTVLVNPDNPRVIYIGSSSAVLKTEDGGETWREVLSVRGQNCTVNFLLSDQREKNSIYAATGNGLFYSNNQGKNWKRIFKGKNFFENECTTLAVLPGIIYVGTRQGLFATQDKGRSWHKETSKLSNSHIFSIDYNPNEPNYIYVACANGVFRAKDNDRAWERIFISHPVEDGKDIEEGIEDQDEQERFSDIRYISTDANNLNNLYLATSKGVYESHNKGETWQLLSDYGLLNKDVRFLFVSDRSRLYAITKSGIFEYVNERWQELSLGLVSSDIRFLAQDNSGNLYAACDNGLFKANLKNHSDSKDSIISFYSKDEPGIQEVQQAAIKYAEVEPGKIKLWREQARKKAVLPQLSIGIDRNTTDLWHWEGGSTTKTDDDILRRGRDSVDWDVTLSWDLGELIWNDDQTSIDVRSRLMVELRNDVLDDVTKLYFERIRLKMEIDSLSIEDRKKRLDKELRLQELTASLDALTGGYFSRAIKNNNGNS